MLSLDHASIKYVSDEWDECVNVSATQAFLRFLEYPLNEETPVDLKQVGVIVMSHLDRLSIPHQPEVESQDFCSMAEETSKSQCWGEMSGGGGSNQDFKVLKGMAIRKLVCTQRFLVGTSQSQQMFYHPWDSENEVGNQRCYPYP